MNDRAKHILTGFLTGAMFGLVTAYFPSPLACVASDLGNALYVLFNIFAVALLYISRIFDIDIFYQDHCGLAVHTFALVNVILYGAIGSVLTLPKRSMEISLGKSFAIIVVVMFVGVCMGLSLFLWQ